MSSDIAWLSAAPAVLDVEQPRSVFVNVSSQLSSLSTSSSSSSLSAAQQQLQAWLMRILCGASASDELASPVVLEFRYESSKHNQNADTINNDTTKVNRKRTIDEIAVKVERNRNDNSDDDNDVDDKRAARSDNNNNNTMQLDHRQKGTRCCFSLRVEPKVVDD